jgi:hypothetical protein
VANVNSIRQILRGAFSIVALITLLLGAVVFLLFMVGLVLGGTAATRLAVAAGDIMQWGIKMATVAVVIGIIDIYVSRNHKLTLNSEEKEANR